MARERACFIIFFFLSLSFFLTRECGGSGIVSSAEIATICFVCAPLPLYMYVDLIASDVFANLCR